MTNRDDHKRLDEAGLEAAIRECARITAPEVSDEEFARIKADNEPRYRNTRADMARAITAYLSAASVKAGEVVAWRDVVRQPDERSLPTYGQIPWDQLGRDVVDSTTARRDDYKFAENLYPGHQIVPGINFNSLARIVDKYRYYGLPCEDESRIRSALVVEPVKGEPVAWLRYAVEGDAPKSCNEDDDGAFPVYRAATPAASVGAMREALEFYANEWMGSVNELGAVVYEPTSALVEDQGKQADAALAAANQSDGGKRTAPASCPNCFNEDDCASVDICNAVADVYRPSDTPPAPQPDCIMTRFSEVTCERTDTCTWPDCKCPRKTPPAPQAVEAVSVDTIARICADDLVPIIETATRVANRTGNTFVIDRQKVATMIAGHFNRALLAKFKMEGR